MAAVLFPDNVRQRKKNHFSKLNLYIKYGGKSIRDNNDENIITFFYLLPYN